MDEMNGYSILADSYRTLVKRGKIDSKIADKYIRIYEFLAACDKDDICILADSSSFNDIIRGYVSLALDEAEVDEETKENVESQMYWIFDSHTSKDALRKLEKE